MGTMQQVILCKKNKGGIIVIKGKSKGKLKRAAVFVLCFILAFGINTGGTSFGSSPDKHLVQWGVEKVWAGASTSLGNVSLTTTQSSASSTLHYFTVVDYNKTTGILTYNMCYSYSVSVNTAYIQANVYMYLLDENSNYVSVLVDHYASAGSSWSRSGNNIVINNATANIGINKSQIRIFREMRAGNTVSERKKSYSDYSSYMNFNQNPTITVTSPVANSAYSEVSGYNTIALAGTVSDENAGDIITIKYNIDGGTTQTVPGTVTTSGSFTTNINVGALSEDSYNLNVWCVDDKGAVSPTVTRPFKMDRTAPVLGTVTFTSATNSVTISGSATDTIAGLPTDKYQYTLSTKPVITWTSQTPRSFTGLTPNTQYSAKFEAKDSVGHISDKQQNIYTKAAVPTAAVSNPTSYTLDVSISDTNPSATQYQINVNTNKYVTPEGALTASPVWITPSGKKITVKGLSPSTPYTFKVKARNGDGVETELSSPVSGTTLIAPPAAPANIIATATSNTITLSWSAVATAESYEVEADGIIKSAGTSTTYTHTGLNPGTPHTYRIRGKNAGGAGSWSTIVEKSTRPSAPDIPLNLTAIPLSTSVTVTWNNVPGATGYDIEVDGVLVNNGPNTNYKHTSLTPGTSHTYRVRSVNAGDKSGWSNTVTATTLVESTHVPSNVSTEASKDKITVSWNAVDGATGYEIEADGVKIDNGTRTSYTHINLEPGTDHRYRVRAKRSGTISDWSVMVTATTLTGEFGVPANLKAYAEDTSVSLTWDAVTDAIAYDIEIDGETISNGTDTFFIHEGLEPDTTHIYRVRAISETETSDWSEPLTVTTFKLPAPGNIRTFASETSIEAVWDSVYGAVYYDMEFNGTIIPDIWDTSYTCEGLKPGRQYTLSIRAKNIYGTSNWSMPINESTVYAGVSVPAVSGIARKNSVTLLWNTVGGEESYDLEVDGEIVEGTSSRTYLHNNLSPGTQHTYRVRTRNGQDTGEWSSTFTAATLAETPDIPTNVTASSSMTSILVTWDKMADAESYEIEADGVVLDNGTGTAYLHNGLSPDTTHTYRVRAKNLGGYSQWSDLITKATVSSVQEYAIDCTTGDEFNLMLSAANIQDLGSYSFTVRYSPEDFEVTDLCGFTARIDTSTGSITGTDIKVTQYEPGTIVFTKAGSAQTYEVWSGVVNSIKLKARREGQLAVTYSIN